MTFPGLLNFWPPKIPPGTPLGSGGSIFFRFESVPYPSEYVCQIWLRSDRRECNACMTIAKCTKTAASSNVSNHLSRTPAAWCASGAAHHARPYQNLGRRISLRSYMIVGASKADQVRYAQATNSTAFQFNSIQFNSIQFNSIQFNSIQFNSIVYFRHTFGP